MQDEIYRVFGGERGQWVVLVIDADAERAMARGDRVAEALAQEQAAGTVAGYDAATAFAPAPETQRARLRARDALDLPALAPRLEAALAERGFDREACAPAVDAFLHPSDRVAPIPDGTGDLGWILSRHVARDHGDTVVALYVRPVADEGKQDRSARALAAIRAADPGVAVTGYAHLEVALKRTLAHDLPRVALVALIFVALTLRAALGRLRDVALAIVSVVVELAIVAALMRALSLRWHVFDALVLPVLVGITIDEAMFLLHAAADANANASNDAIAHTLRAQGPLVASTALTTAAGFVALLACRFDGLFDLGAVGALGSVAGLACALVVVPAGLRIAQRPVK